MYNDYEPTRASLVESNRQYLLAVINAHPEMAHMVPPEMLVIAPETLKVMLKNKTAKPRQPKKSKDDPLPPDTVRTLTLVAIETANKYGISVDDLIGNNSSRLLTLPRGDFATACRALRPIPSYHTIGLFMNGRDHSTVMHFARKWLWSQESA